MAQITITTAEKLELTILTKFSFDDQKIDFDPTENHPWELNDMSGVAKVQYSASCGREITPEEADFMYRHGWSDGAHAQRVQLQLGEDEYDSLKEAGLDEGEIDDDFIMSAEALRHAKRAMDASKDRCELLLQAISPDAERASITPRI